MPGTIDPQDAAELYEAENDGDTVSEWTRVGEQHIRTSRWQEHYYLVLRDADGQHWGVRYAHGLTEDQENDVPWEKESDGPIPLVRLYPREVTTTVYEDKPIGAVAD